MNRDRIGKYQIIGELGRGTMGEVYRALDPILHRQVALKTLSARMGSDEDTLHRFQREARAAALLNHPNIVTIHDFGDDGGILYMAMELLEGGNLRDAIDADSLRALDEKLSVMDAVLCGLDYAHARGVIHRDIKPANIHLGPGGQVKIMDFGLARTNTSDMTQDGIVVGTPNYMSPEQALGERVDARSDLFSTGAVLYEVLTGHKPFEADSTPTVLYQVVHREAPPLRRWAPDVPEPIVAVVDRALLKDRERRYESAAQMREALLDAARAARGERPVAPPLPDSPPVSLSGSLPGTRVRRSRSGPAPLGRSRRSAWLPAPVWAGLGLALMIAASAVWLTFGPARPHEAPPEKRDTQVGELTKALVATQVQLARRELQDKNWTAAVTQAENALRLAPGHPGALRSLAEARARLAELDRAIVTAREQLAAGDTEGASVQLSHILELDPRHPAAAELSASLNDVFRSQSEAAAASMRIAREEARAAGVTDTGEFRSADTTAREATDLAAREEFADATRNFLKARDAFDRARRAARPSATRADAPPEGTSGGPAAASARTSPPSPAGGDRSEEASSEAGGPPGPGRTSPAPTPLPPPRLFVSDKTTVTTPSAGALAGFETEGVRTRRQPRFAGRMVFEVLPPEVRPGEPFVVRIHLVNQGSNTVRIRGIELATVVDGERTPAPARPLVRAVAARSRALVAEFSSTWSATGSWVLEAVVSGDDNEQVRSRLTAN